MNEPKKTSTPADPERVRDVTRVVLEVLDEWQESRKKPKGWFFRFCEGITKNWVVLSALGLVLACLYTGVSPFHTLEDVAREQKKRQFTLEMASRHLKLGEDYLDVSRYANAKAEFNKALALDQANVKAQLGLIKAETGELVRGMREGKKQTGCCPEVIKKRLDLVLAEKPDDPHIQVILGDLAYVQGKDEEAAACYNRAKKSGSKDLKVPSAYFGLGLIYDKQGETNKALEMWKKAVSLSDWNTEYRNNLAYLYSKKEDYPQAIATYEEIIDNDPHSLISYHEIALAHRLQGDLKAARDYEQELVSLMAKVPDETAEGVEGNKAPWYYKTETGKEIFLTLGAQKEVLAHYSLAVTQYLLGNMAEARVTVKGAPAVKPGDQAAILTLMDDDLTHLAKKQPSWSERISQLRRELFPAPFSGGR